MASTLLTRWTLAAALAALMTPAAPALAHAASGSTAAQDVERDQGARGYKEKDKDKDKDKDGDQDRGRGRDAGGDEEQERIAKSFKVGATGSLVLTNISGDIRVTGGSGAEIVIDAVKHARGRGGMDGRQQLQNLDVSISEAGGRVEVRTYHRGKNDRSWVDYTVTVPAGTRVDLQSVSGDVTVRNVKGETRAESVSGNVVCDGLGRVTQIKSVSGNVELTNSQSDTDLLLSTISGDVRAAALKARGLTLSTVSGEASIKGCECTRAQLKTVSGSLSYSGPLAQGGRYEGNAHSGDIRFFPSGPVGYELEASTFSGDIHTEPPLKVTSSSRGHGPGQSLRGVAGNSGAFLVLTTFSGDIQVGGSSGGR
jgi:DUF4097 and DUF4098 domain-containing protein YvlB